MSSSAVRYAYLEVIKTLNMFLSYHSLSTVFMRLDYSDVTGDDTWTLMFQADIITVLVRHNAVCCSSERSNFLFCGATAQRGPGPPHSWGFWITHRYTTVGRTPLDGWSVLRKDFYLNIHNNHKGQTSIPLAGIEPVILASDRLQTLTFDRSATGIGERNIVLLNLGSWKFPYTSC